MIIVDWSIIHLFIIDGHYDKPLLPRIQLVWTWVELLKQESQYEQLRLSFLSYANN
jgi:hypothetical protein